MESLKAWKKSLKDNLTLALKEAKGNFSRELFTKEEYKQKVNELKEDYRKTLAKGMPQKGEVLEQEKMVEIKEGFDEKENTVVCLVSKKKAKKPYQVTGIEETVSKNNWKAWLYLGPIVVLVTVFLLYPLVNTIFISFTRNYSQITGKFDGLTFDNFGVILGLTEYNGAINTTFTRFAIPNTVILLLTVPISTFLALIISVALNSIKWFRNFLQTLFFLPYVTNAIAIGMVFNVIFDQHGVINYIFNTPGFTWITGDGANRYIAMIPLMIYIVWNALPFKILILLSGLQGIDKQYYQAAQIDSAPRGKVLAKITVPLLSPQILYILVTSFMGAFKEYTSIIGLFGTSASAAETGDMQTIVYYIYQNMSTQTSFAAAAAVFLFVIILIFTALQFYVGKKRVHY